MFFAASIFLFICQSLPSFHIIFSLCNLNWLNIAPFYFTSWKTLACFSLSNKKKFLWITTSKFSPANSIWPLLFSMFGTITSVEYLGVILALFTLFRKNLQLYFIFLLICLVLHSLFQTMLSFSYIKKKTTKKIFFFFLFCLCKNLVQKKIQIGRYTGKDCADHTKRTIETKEKTAP